MKMEMPRINSSCAWLMWKSIEYNKKSTFVLFITFTYTIRLSCRLFLSTPFSVHKFHRRLSFNLQCLCDWATKQFKLLQNSIPKFRLLEFIMEWDFSRAVQMKNLLCVFTVGDSYSTEDGVNVCDLCQKRFETQGIIKLTSSNSIDCPKYFRFISLIYLYF